MTEIEERFADEEDYRRSLDERIKQKATKLGASANQIRFDDSVKRFLQLLSSDSDILILKGAVALEARLSHSGHQLDNRTKDLDLATNQNVDALHAAIKAACSRSMGYAWGFKFEIYKELDLDDQYKPIELTIRVILAGRVWHDFTVDLVGKEHMAEATRLSRLSLGPDLDGNPTPSLYVQGLEFSLTDKLSAFQGVYVGSRPSSRYRDLPDMVLLAKLFSDEKITAGALRHALVAVFGDQTVPTVFPKPPKGWPTNIAVRAKGIPTDISALCLLAGSFWDPVLSRDSAVDDGATWSGGQWIS